MHNRRSLISYLRKLPMILSEQEQSFVQTAIKETESETLKQAARKLGDFNWQSELTEAALAVAIDALDDLRQRLEDKFADAPDEEEVFLVNDHCAIVLSLESLRQTQARIL